MKAIDNGLCNQWKKTQLPVWN